MSIKGIENGDLLRAFQAQEQEKKLMEKKELVVDRAFHLYAVIRRASAEVLLNPPY